MADPTPPGAWRRDPAVSRGAPARILVDGTAVNAFEGECLAVALAASGRLTLRRSPNGGTVRGAFCLMGSCQECLVHVDGTPVVSCLEVVRDGMTVELDRLAHDLSNLSGH